jgi:hypothetical protein
MPTALSKISMHQAEPTRRVQRATERLLQYAKQYQHVETTIRASDMILKAQSDASYLSEALARSRAGILLYLKHANGSISSIIGAISGVTPTVCSSVAGAEYVALFLASKEMISARHVLRDLGWPQSTTIIGCDNYCAVKLPRAQ